MFEHAIAERMSALAEYTDTYKKVTTKKEEIVVAFPKPKNGSGFPARAFAILP